MRLLPWNGRMMMQEPAWDNLLEDFFGRNLTASGERSEWRPSADIVEHDDYYKVTMDLPGVDKKNVRITVEDGRLTISGERTEERKQEEGRVRRYERFSGSFQRSFGLPEGIDPDSIEAGYRDGVLELTVPKPVEVKPKQIEVKVR